MRGFLYGQTEYNILKSTNRMDDYIEMAKNANFDFLSITDNNLAGAFKFYKKCKENNIKPVIGLEYSFTTDDQNVSKVILYAINNNGYRNLLKITSINKIKKTTTLEEIKDYLSDIYVIYIFNNSYLERLLFKKEYKMLDDYITYLKTLSDNPMIGISYTNSLSKIDLNKEMDELSKSLGILCVPVHQCMYLKNADSVIYEHLTLIGGEQVKIGDLDDYSFEADPLDSKIIDKMITSINLDIYNDRVLLPVYPNTKGAKSKEYLSGLCYKGLEKRGLYNNKNYMDRLNYELSIIDKMGYNDYFLIVWDFIKYAKKNDVLVGPGRGSAAGSLVAYSMGITDVDPLKYDLLFERFLNPERVSMPDIDTDFPDDARDMVIDHVKELYGKRHVCNISAFGTFQEKSAIRELARVLKFDNNRTEKIIDMVERYGFDRLIEEYKDNELYTFFYVARGLVDLPKHISTHAAGIVLSYLPLDDIIPLQEGIGGLYQSQMEATDLERIGLLKMDFLALRNLKMIHEMMQEIPGFDVKALRNIPLNDSKTFELLSKADTLGVFQLESDGIKNVLRKLKPSCFMDLVAVLALFRPGPMDNIDQYIANKHSKNVNYLHPDLEPILKETYGIIVYQEQIMQIAQRFAGYSLGEADMLRRAISKKNEAMLQKSEQEFIDRSVNKGYDAKLAKEIYDLIYKFANYGFNKSHSVAYGLVAYQMAYLKANYFDIFMANILNNVISSTTTMLQYITYAKNHGLNILKPNVNYSSDKFERTKAGLCMPFNAIYSVGAVAANKIVEEREKNGKYQSFDDFRIRTNTSSDVVTALIYAGAFDQFGKAKKELANQSSNEDALFIKHLTNVIETTDEFDFSYLQEMEKKYLGMNIEYNIFNGSREFYYREQAKPLKLIKVKENVVTIVEFTDIKEITTKNNKKMVVGSLADMNKSYRFVMFSDLYNQVKTLEKNHLYSVYGVLDYDKKNELSFIINGIKLLK